MGIYVGDFVFLLESDAEESCFKQILSDKVTTDFMGDADNFLRSSFKWNLRPDGNLSVHVSQQASAEHTASRFGLEGYNWVPLVTPYHSGCPIDSIPYLEPYNHDLTKRKASYQYICGSINWLAI